MLRIQQLVKAIPRRISTTFVVAGQRSGLKVGPKVNIFQRGETLLYSYLDEYFDFDKVGTRSVYDQGGAACVNIPNPWVSEYDQSGFIRAYYTKHGLFVRPYALDSSVAHYELSGIDSAPVSKNKDSILVLEYLNQVKIESGITKIALKATVPGNLKNINARLKEKYSIEECKKVIDFKVNTWKGTEWEQYLFPPTLFSSKNFSKYHSLAMAWNQEEKKPSGPDYIRDSFNKMKGGTV